MVLNPVIFSFIAYIEHYPTNFGLLVPQGKAAASTQIPKSPWMPFPVLFAAIRSLVPPSDMELINTHYEQLKVCKVVPLDASICLD